MRTDAGPGSTYPGDLSAVLRAVEGKFDAHAIDAALADVAHAVDRNSLQKLARIPGVNPSRLISGGAGAMARFRQTNAALIRSVPATMAADIGATLEDVDVRDLHVKDVGQILAERFGVAESKGEFWARDQTLKLYANVQETRQRAAGAASYQWEHSDDERVRGRPGGVWARNSSDHWVLGNTIQRWDTPPVTNPKTGGCNHPGHDPQCRCSAYPIFEGDPVEVAPPADNPVTPEEEAAGLRELVAEPPPPPAFRPLVRVQVPVQLAPESVIRARAEELSANMAEVGETRSRAGVEVRDAIREQIVAAVPNAVSKDPSGASLTIDDAALELMGADGGHYPDSGRVIVSTRVQENAKRALEALASGAEATFEERDALRVIVHEELHGHSLSTAESYSGIGKILEEVGTELHARHITGEIFGVKHSNFVYAEYVQKVRIIVETSGKDTDELIRNAHTKAALVDGSFFSSPEAHLEAFLAALDVDPEDRTFMRGLLLQLKA